MNLQTKPCHPVSGILIISFDYGYSIDEVITMAKQGMKRPEVTHTKPRNEEPPVPELQGSAKRSKKKNKPVTEG